MRVHAKPAGTHTAEELRTCLPRSATDGAGLPSQIDVQAGDKTLAGDHAKTVTRSGAPRQRPIRTDRPSATAHPDPSMRRLIYLSREERD